MPIDLRHLDEENGIEATLQEHKVKWHKSCHTKLNITKLLRGNLPYRKFELDIPPLESTLAEVSLLLQISAFL